MSIEEWAKDFKGYVNELSLLRDDYKGVMEYIDDALELLKEQSVKPRRNGRVWLCGNCGEYVGFEDHDENDPNEFDNYCRKCGKAVAWGD